MFDPIGPMSSLRSALEELAAEHLRSLTDDALEADYGELQRTAEVLEAERLRRLAEIHRRQSHRRDGYLSTASWLVDRHRKGWSAAARDIRTARSLERMPRTRQALATGELSASAVQMLVAARHAHPAQFHEAEPTLVEAAKRLPARQLRHTMAYWQRQVHWEQGLRDAERVRARRRLAVTTTTFGMVRVDGDLDPENGETVLTALRAFLDAERGRTGTDVATPAQRRADALGEICRRWLDGTERPSVGGERPHVTVIVDLDALRASGGSRSELDHTGPIHPEIVRRLACDATVSRVLAKGSSEPLDAGRRTSVVPAPLRRAVVVRDRHCRFPGCDRPPPWCDAHHVTHWANGGSTSLGNLVLMCRRHHRLVHASGSVQLTMEAGEPVFRRPDGTVITGGADAPTRLRPPSGARSAGSAPRRTPSAVPG
jgi:hypothetical protein